jgi:hypothetical protein
VEKQVMLEMLVGQFMKSANGAELLGHLQKQGLTQDQAQNAVGATAEGAMQQLGGSQGGGLGGIAGMLAGGLGGGQPNGQLPSLSAMTQPVAAFVSKKTGLQPAIAAMVVNAALPKLLELLKGRQGNEQRQDGGGLAGALGGLLG